MTKRRTKLFKAKYSPTQLREMRKTAMTLSHSMRKGKRWSMSESLRLAWKIVKGRLTTKLKGVTFGSRQQAIRRLLNYDPRRVVFTTRRERDNPDDANAIAVDVTVIGKGTFHMGYLAKEIAVFLAPVLDKNHQPTIIINWQIIGEEIKGIKLTMELVPGVTSLNDKSTIDRNEDYALIAIR